MPGRASRGAANARPNAGAARHSRSGSILERGNRLRSSPLLCCWSDPQPARPPAPGRRARLQAARLAPLRPATSSSSAALGHPRASLLRRHARRPAAARQRSRHQQRAAGLRPRLGAVWIAGLAGRADRHAAQRPADLLERQFAGERIEHGVLIAGPFSSHGNPPLCRPRGPVGTRQPHRARAPIEML